VRSVAVQPCERAAARSSERESTGTPTDVALDSFALP